MTAEKQRFTDKRIFLDGASFYGCRFERCTFIFSGVNPCALEGCAFGPGCQWEMEGPAKNTLEFLTALYRGGAKEMIDATIDAVRQGRPTKGPLPN